MNLPDTVAATTTNTLTGEYCRRDAHRMVVCEGGLLSDLNREDSVPTTGNVVNVDSNHLEICHQDRANIMPHEARRSVQRALLGSGFYPLYVANSGASRALTGRECWNGSEWTAGLEQGGYGDDCIGRGKCR